MDLQCSLLTFFILDRSIDIILVIRMIWHRAWNGIMPDGRNQRKPAFPGRYYIMKSTIQKGRQWSVKMKSNDRKAEFTLRISLWKSNKCKRFNKPSWNISHAEGRPDESGSPVTPAIFLWLCRRSSRKKSVYFKIKLNLISLISQFVICKNGIKKHRSYK